MIGDLLRAVGQLGDPRFLGVVLKALAITLAVLAAVSAGTLWLLGWLLPDTLNLWFTTVDLTAPWLSWAGVGIMLVGSVFLMLPVAFVCVGFFLDDIADAVEARHYPHLPKARRLSMAATIRDAAGFLGLVALANAVALVIYFASTVLAPFVFWLVNGYLLGREYFQLVAARRLGLAGARKLRRAHRLEIWTAGVLMAVPLSVPVLNLLVPVLGVAAYTHMAHRLIAADGLHSV